MKNSIFKRYLDHTAKQIDEELEVCRVSTIKKLSEVNFRLVPLAEAFFSSCSEGKRLRGAMVKLGYDMVSDNELPDLGPAVAYEIFQTGILAHDDIIDQSTTRRGKPSMYIALGGNHYGISQTICLGDLGMFLSSKMVLDSQFPPDVKLKAIQSFINVQYNTVVGEILDVELPYGGRDDISSDDIYPVYDLKTAHYTIIGPLQLGAVLANANDIILDYIQLLGKEIGIAFQIKDDLLGIFSSEEEIGKSVTTDIEEGKITTLWHKAYTSSNVSQKKHLDQIYGKKEISHSDQTTVKKIFTDTGAFADAEASISEHLATAKSYISEIPINKHHKEILFSFCDFMEQRKK